MANPSNSAVAPATGKIPNLTYPPVQERILPNGLRVVVIEDHRIPIVTVRLGCGGGRVNNPTDNLGALQVALDLIFEGTSRYTSKELAHQFDQLAIQTETDVYLESVRLLVSALSPHLERAVELLADVLLDASFDAAELERLKVRWASFLVAERSQPRFLAAERTMQALFPEHPYSQVSFPLAHLSAMESARIRTVFESRVVPERTVLLFSGPVNIERAAQLATDFLGAWHPAGSPPVELAPVKPAQGGVLLVHRPGSVQTHFEVARTGPTRRDADFLLLKLTNQIFGGGASSRLFLNLREDKGYTYGAYSLVRGYRNGGFLSATADVRSDVVADAIHQTLLEMNTIQSQEASHSEIELARTEMIGDLIRRMETVSGTAALELDRRLNDLPEDFYREYIPTLHRMDGKQILECARRNFDTSNVVITVVGDAQSVLKDLEQFGDVRIYDHHGARLETLP